MICKLRLLKDPKPSNRAHIAFYCNRRPWYFCFFSKETDLVCYTYWAAFARALSAIVKNKRLEAIYWKPQAIFKMCSIAEWQSVCFCILIICVPNYVDGEVWTGEVCAEENLLRSGWGIYLCCFEDGNFYNVITIS